MNNHLNTEQLVRKVRLALPGTQAVYLFGSQAKGQAREDSDLDIAVLTEGEFSETALWEVAQQIASNIGMEVDLLDLSKASTVMQLQVITQGRQLYCADERACGEFEDRVFSNYVWLNEERAGILQDIAKRGSIHG